LVEAFAVQKQEMQPYRFDTRQAASYPGTRSLRIKAAQVVYHYPFSMNKAI